MTKLQMVNEILKPKTEAQKADAEYYARINTKKAIEKAYNKLVVAYREA